MKTASILLLLLLPFCSLPAQIAMELSLLSDGFNQPLGITNAGDDRLFVVEKTGRIRILSKSGQINETPFLNISSKIRTNSERGLLGLVFHPNYSNNGYFFINYINSDGNTVIARLQVSADDPDIADPGSEKVLLTVNQPFANHNAGDLHFGPDGYLYIPLGDGGSGGDPNGFGQNRRSFLGKLLRIDVDNGDPYAIPPDNPFAETDETLDEIWALGLRNPWRISFDRLTGDLWIGDVGQGDWEEIDFQPAGSTGGENYGWRCYEGNDAFNTSNCGDANTYTFPVHVYESDLPTGCSVNGGFVYRGATFPLLYGKYIYSDYCSGRIWALERDEDDQWVNTELFDGPSFDYVSMGEDQNGELYLTAIQSGQVFQIRDQTTSTRERMLDAQLQVRPNPFGNQLWIEGRLPESGQYRLQLLNLHGQVLWESTRRLDVEFQQQIATKALPSGVYFFQLERNGARRVIRVVKE